MADEDSGEDTRMGRNMILISIQTARGRVGSLRVLIVCPVSYS